MITNSEQKEASNKPFIAEGNSVYGEDGHWIVCCPNCEKQHEYTGWFDSGGKTLCICGCEFSTSKVWLDDKRYIQ